MVHSPAVLCCTYFAVILKGLWPSEPVSDTGLSTASSWPVRPLNRKSKIQRPLTGVSAYHCVSPCITVYHQHLIGGLGGGSNSKSESHHPSDKLNTSLEPWDTLLLQICNSAHFFDKVKDKVQGRPIEVGVFSPSSCSPWSCSPVVRARRPLLFFQKPIA